MKRIYLMRHGKAEDGFNKSDIERDLTDKGRKKTQKVAKSLVQKNLLPQKILVSIANRTLQTADIICNYLKLDKERIFEEKDLYLASSNSILDVIYTIDDDVNDLMIIGHNPGISSLATYLSNVEMDWMVTSALIVIEVNAGKWHEIPLSKRKLLHHIKPKDF